MFPEQKDKTSRFLIGTSRNDGIVNNMRQRFVEMMDLSHYCASFKTSYKLLTVSGWTVGLLTYRACPFAHTIKFKLKKTASPQGHTRHPPSVSFTTSASQERGREGGGRGGMSSQRVVCEISAAVVAHTHTPAVESQVFVQLTEV